MFPELNKWRKGKAIQCFHSLLRASSAYFENVDSKPPRKHTHTHTPTQMSLTPPFWYFSLSSHFPVLFPSSALPSLLLFLPQFALTVSAQGLGISIHIRNHKDPPPSGPREEAWGSEPLGDLRHFWKYIKFFWLLKATVWLMFSKHRVQMLGHNGNMKMTVSYSENPHHLNL